MPAQDYGKLFGKKTPEKKNKPDTMKEKEKLEIQNLKDEMTQKIKKDPELAQKAAQLIIDMLNSKNKTKDK